MRARDEAKSGRTLFAAITLGALFLILLVAKLLDPLPGERVSGVPATGGRTTTPGTGHSSPSSAAPAASRSTAPSQGLELRGMLGDRRLSMPILGISPASLERDFDDARGGGSRRHEALDILAPRGTPILAVDDGRVAKLFVSDAGGLTVYQFDESETYCYYYAHLDEWAPGLAEGQVLRRGDVVGTVGTTGNAPKNTPHLHFAITRLGADKRWWQGTPVDPHPILVGGSS